MKREANWGERARAWDEAVGVVLDRVFPPAANPWRQLGALAFVSFVVCAASGIYLYAVFDTSVAGAYESGRALDRDVVVGRLMRGVHRYGADAFAVFTALHLLRETARGHFARFRAWSWISGVLLVPLAWIAGVTGFWLAWDERAVFSAAATAEWLAAWPWSAGHFARNFLSAASVTDRFFSLVVFLHLGVPLLALAVTWAHLARMARPRAWPAGSLLLGVCASLAVLALAHPVTSLGRAETLSVPATIAVDWFYLFPHALAAVVTPEGLSMAVVPLALASLALPWWPRLHASPAAVVNPDWCNGCERCVADCPFDAVTMVPVSPERGAGKRAAVAPERCASCGICAGACPSSTPFRRTVPLATGIDLPAQPIEALRRELDAALEGGAHAVLVFACAPGRLVLGESRARVIRIECLAMLPPSFIDYALRRGAAGVVLAGCRQGDCEYRLGDAWMASRLAGERPPQLRGARRGRVRLVHAGFDGAAVGRAVQDLEEPFHA